MCFYFVNCYFVCISKKSEKKRKKAKRKQKTQETFNFGIIVDSREAVSINEEGSCMPLTYFTPGTPCKTTLQDLDRDVDIDILKGQDVFITPGSPS